MAKKTKKKTKARKVKLKRKSTKTMITELWTHVISLERRCERIEQNLDSRVFLEQQSLKHVIRLFNRRMQRITELSGPLLDDRDSTT